MEPLRPSPDELAAPRIPRFRALFRTLKLSTITLLLLFAIRLIWGYNAQRQIETRLAQYRARGELTRTADFNPPSIPDEQNAAFYILRAAKALTRPERRDAEGLQPQDTCTPKIERIARDWIATNSEVFELVKLATKCDRAVWKSDRDFPETTKSGFEAVWKINNLLITASTIEFKDGDHASCLSDLEQAFRIDRMLRSQPIWATQSFHSVDSIVFAEQIEQLAAFLKVKGDAQQKQPSTGIFVHHPASRDQVRTLIAFFLDEDPDRAASLKSLYAGRAFINEWTTAACQGGFWKYRWRDRHPDNWINRLEWWWIAPRVKAYAAGEMDRYTALIEAVHASNPPVSWAMARPNPQSFKGPIGVYPVDYLEELLSITYLIHEWRPIIPKAIHDRRQAAVYLAALLYQIDHDSIPTSVHQLSPEYFSAIPNDPITNNSTAWKLLPLPPKPVGAAPSSRTSKK
jgi:hypothetical protein